MDPNINISKHNPLGCSSYIKLPKELDHLRNCLINIQNIDESECFEDVWPDINILQIIIQQELQNQANIFQKHLKT